MGERPDRRVKKTRHQISLPFLVCFAAFQHCLQAVTLVLNTCPQRSAESGEGRPCQSWSQPMYMLWYAVTVTVFQFGWASVQVRVPTDPPTHISLAASRSAQLPSPSVPDHVALPITRSERFSDHVTTQTTHPNNKSPTKVQQKLSNLAPPLRQPTWPLPVSLRRTRLSSTASGTPSTSRRRSSPMPWLGDEPAISTAHWTPSRSFVGRARCVRARKCSVLSFLLSVSRVRMPSTCRWLLGSGADGDVGPADAPAFFRLAS